MKINEMYFTAESVANGKHLELIKWLTEYNDQYYNLIKVIQEDDSVVVYWVQNIYGLDEDKLEFLDIDNEDEIGTTVYLPDNSSVFIKKSEENSVLTDWLKEHPEYHYHQLLHRYVKDEDSLQD